MNIKQWVKHSHNPFHSKTKQIRQWHAKRSIKHIFLLVSHVCTVSYNDSKTYIISCCYIVYSKRQSKMQHNYIVNVDYTIFIYESPTSQFFINACKGCITLQLCNMLCLRKASLYMHHTGRNADIVCVAYCHT